MSDAMADTEVPVLVAGGSQGGMFMGALLGRTRLPGKLLVDDEHPVQYAAAVQRAVSLIGRGAGVSGLGPARRDAIEQCRDQIFCRDHVRHRARDFV
jgi:hypothetical protein